MFLCPGSENRTSKEKKKTSLRKTEKIRPQNLSTSAVKLQLKNNHRSSTDTIDLFLHNLSNNQKKETISENHICVGIRKIKKINELLRKKNK